jgi:RHS repeat-associated protein
VLNGTTANYKYDGLGRRVEKEVISVGTTVTRYVYDNEDILLELDGSNTILARYTHGPGIDEPLIMEKGGQGFFYQADGLGSITEITDSAGAIKQRYTYSSYGKIESQLDPNFIQPYTFTSRELDSETDLYFYRARYYDADVGRFLQADLIGFAGGSNFYTGVNNNPATFIDPYGLYAGPISPGSGPFPAIDLQSGIPLIDYTILSTINTIVNAANLAANSIVNALQPIVELAGSDQVLNLGIAIPGPDPVEAVSRGSRLICVIGAFKGADALRRGNKQALDALRQALKEANIPYSDKLRQQFHREISGQGNQTYQDLLRAAREFVEAKK